MLNLINLKKLANSKLLATSLLSASLMGLLTTTTPASETPLEANGTISPSSFTKEDRVAKKIELEGTVTLDLSHLVETIVVPGELAKPQKLDILFLADNTASMQAPIANVRNNAQELLTLLNDTYGPDGEGYGPGGGDMQVGVAYYRADPSEYGCPGGVTCTKKWDKISWYWKKKNGVWKKRYKYYVRTINLSGEILRTQTKYSWDGTKDNYEEDFLRTKGQVEHRAYKLLEEVNGGDISDAVSAINQWEHKSEGDNFLWPEGNFFALHQAATNGAVTNSGYSTGKNTGWREDSDKKIIVMFGDAESVTRAIGLTETINALNDNDITVIAINVQDNGTPTEYQFNSDEQFYSPNPNAVTITSATNGEYANAYSNAIANSMVTLIGTAAMVDTSTTTEVYPEVNISFATVPDPLLPLGTFVDDKCTDPLGCVKYECIDPLGCDQVSHDESRRFKMTFQGNIPEDFVFDTVAVDASGNNITGAVSNNDINLLTID